MKPSEQWARVKRLGTHGLRRGAWYPVVHRVTAEMLIVDVAKRNVPVPLEAVDLSEAPPAAWSVVVWTDRDPGVQRVSASGFAMRYAVCPVCRARAELPSGEPESMSCTGCSGEYGFDWGHPC